MWSEGSSYKDSLGDPSYKMWEQEDSLDNAWPLRSMAGERFKKFMFLKTAKGIKVLIGVPIVLLLVQ